jgi:ribosomal protein S10
MKKKYTLKIKLKTLKKKFFKKKKKKKIFKKKKKNIKYKNFFNKKKKKIFNLLRSPHVNKKAQEHFLCNDFYTNNLNISFFTLHQLFNFIILFKKQFCTNTIIQFKITKN